MKIPYLNGVKAFIIYTIANKFKIEDIGTWYLSGSQLLSALKEFTKANKTLVQKQADISIIKSHPQAYHTSRLLDFTKKLNEILDQDSQSECLDCIVTDLKLSGI